jgi:hypothetical protein
VKKEMKLNSVHLFGILLLSLLLGSFLGRFIDIGDKYKEGNQNESETPNQHTGGDIDMAPKPSPQVSGPDPSLALSGNDNGESASTAPQKQQQQQQQQLDNFSPLFDTILPSNSNNDKETFEPYAPLREKLSNKSDSSKGITKDQIPPGQEHLYVLKSQVVPPVCPTNPGFNNRNQESGDYNNDDDDDGEDSNLELEQEDSSGLSNGLGAAFRGTGGSKNKKCPPCPACARCPEPSFECKKVPNYSVNSNGSMSVPRPVLADFTQFGM